MSILGKATSGGRVLVVGNGVAQAVTIAVAPMLTRLYTTDEIGYLTMYVSVFAILGLVASLRYDQAVLAAEDETTAAHALAASVAVSIAFGLLVAVPATVLVLLTDDGSMVPRSVARFVAVLLPVGMASTGVFQGLLAWVTRRGEFQVLARTRMWQSVAGAVIQVAGGFMAWGHQALMIGHTVGRTAGVGTLWRRRPDGFPGTVTRADVRAVLGEFRRFPLYAGPATILNNSALLLPTILLGAFYGSTVAGWFGMGQRVIGIPMFVIGGAAANVYAARFVECRKEGRAALRALMKRTVFRMLPFSAVVLIGSLFGPPVFGFVFGEEWRTAGSYVSMLAAPFAFQLLTSPVSITANLMGRQGIQFVFDAVRIVLVAGVLVVVPRSGGSPETAVAWLAGVLAVTYVGYLGLYWSVIAGEEAA